MSDDSRPFLRTAGFHLYQAFPKLGVTTRAQLRDALDAGSDDRGISGRPGPGR